MLNSTSSITSSWSYEKVITFAIFLILIDGLAILGNTLVIVVVLWTQNLRRREANVFVLSLALSDLLVALTIVPMTIASLVTYRHFLYVTYKTFLGFANFFFCICSITNLTLLSLDRYFAITSPYRYLDFMTRKKACFMCVMIWVYALALSLPPSFGFSSFGCFIPNFDTCEKEVWRSSDTLVFAVLALGLTYVLSLLSMSFCYWKIFKVARSHSRQIAAQQSINLTINKNNNLRNIENQFEGRTEKMRKIEVTTIEDVTSLESHADQIVSHGDAKSSHMNPRKEPWFCYRDYKLRRNKEDCRNFHTKDGNSASNLQHVSNDLSKVNPSPSSLQTGSNNHSAKKEMSVARNFLIIIGLYVLCWGPFCFMLAAEIIIGEKFNEEASLICLWIGYVNSCVNPFIYTWKYKQFRTALLRLWRKFKQRICKR